MKNEQLKNLIKEEIKNLLELETAPAAAPKTSTEVKKLTDYLGGVGKTALAQINQPAELDSVLNAILISFDFMFYKIYNIISYINMAGISWMFIIYFSCGFVIYSFFIMYAGVKYIQFKSIQTTAILVEYLEVLWNIDDQAIFAGIISFYFGIF